MHTNQPILGNVARVAAFLFAAAAGTGLSAQQYTTPNLQSSLKLPADLFSSDLAASSSSSSSSSTDATDAVSAERTTLSEGMQPPPRRRYGRPRYTDSSHNPDGSSKYAFLAGGGFTLPTGGTHAYAKTNFNIQAGVGRNFNQHTGVILQFDYAKFGIQTNTLNSLLKEYNNLGATGQDGGPLNQLGGGSHIWSFSLNPIYNIGGSEKTGAYVTGGVGFYHKYTNFTVPTIGTAYDYYYGYYQFQANQTIDDYTSNAVGVNGGIGFTYKPSRFANQRFYAEARYVYTANKRRPFYDGLTGTSLSSTYFNVFPQNSAPTTFIPVTFGVRF